MYSTHLWYKSGWSILYHGFRYRQTTPNDKLRPSCKIVAETYFAAGCDVHCARADFIQSPGFAATAGRPQISNSLQFNGQISSIVSYISHILGSLSSDQRPSSPYIFFYRSPLWTYKKLPPIKWKCDVQENAILSDNTGFEFQQWIEYKKIQLVRF